jgi:glyoxylase-like metal-dependent hydrolase (beta-lactamase superfamily II)
VSQPPRTVTADELRQALDRGDELTVLDVRPREDFEGWHVPGSRNLPVYEDLKAGDTRALAEIDPDAEPVVTVCGRGAVADRATQALREAGVDARTLDGGLRAWSFAWNTAQAQLASDTTVLQVRRVGKGCLSYLVASEGRAVTVDPAVDPQILQDLADERGWTIEAVLETHLHADHVSRARPLAEATGGDHLVPEGEPADFDHQPVHDGTTIEVGQATLRAVETPGHTPASTSYLVDGEALLTGDTLFTGAVGRPDLEAEGREEARARQLHASLERLLGLDDDVTVLPAHADRPPAFDDELHAARLAAVADRVDLLGLGEDAFVERILEMLPETPPNHETIVDHNRRARTPEADLADLEAGANRCAAG